jgi:transcriptional regulator with XRE-family HTH domain
MKLDAKRLNYEMAKACMNMKELSEKSGVSKQTLVAAKAGRRNPKPSTIGKIAKALDVIIDDIIEKGD